LSAFPSASLAGKAFAPGRAKKGASFFIDGGTLGVAGGRLAASRLAPLVKRREVDGLFVVNDLTAVA
jgi:hypothetical protein